MCISVQGTLARCGGEDNKGSLQIWQVSGRIPRNYIRDEEPVRVLMEIIRNNAM
jgi:hypothetical protein